MENVKKVKRDLFGEVRAIVETSNVGNKVELLDFIDHELDLLAKKSASRGKSTKEVERDDIIKDLILGAMEEIGEPATVSEILKNEKVANYTYTQGGEEKNITSSKASAMLKQMLDTKVVKSTEKGKSYFSLI